MIKQYAVGLQSVENRLAPGVFLLQLNSFFEEANAQQGRLAALPGEIDLRYGLPPDVLPDIFLQHRIAHPPFAFFGIEFLLFQVKAVFAIEVADGADGLGEHVETAACQEWMRIAHNRTSIALSESLRGTCLLAS